MESDPPVFDYCKYGFKKDIETKTLRPVMMPNGSKTAPDEVLRSTKCGCELSKCDTYQCGCKKNNIPCTEFCNYYEYECNNNWNRDKNAIEYEQEDHDDYESECDSSNEFNE